MDKVSLLIPYNFPKNKKFLAKVALLTRVYYTIFPLSIGMVSYLLCCSIIQWSNNGKDVVILFFLDKTLKSLYIDWFLTSSSNLILITFQTMIEHLLPCLIRPQIPQPPWWPIALFWPRPLQQPLRPQIILAAEEVALIFKPKPPDSFCINWRPAMP